MSNILESFKNLSINSRIGKFIDIYLGKKVSRASAEMAYYMTLSIFPILICVYAILDYHQIIDLLMQDTLNSVLPGEVISVVGDFMKYLSSNATQAMFITGAIVTITTSSGAFRSFFKIAEEIHGETRYKGVKRTVFSYICSFALLFIIYLVIVAVLAADWAINFLSSNIENEFSNMLWLAVRFLLLFIFMFLVLYWLYRLMGHVVGGEDVSYVPGAAAASIALVVVSVIFSWSMSASVRYSLIYGSLASLIILMIWLYVVSNILIMGGAFNYVLNEV